MAVPLRALLATLSFVVVSSLPGQTPPAREGPAAAAATAASGGTAGALQVDGLEDGDPLTVAATASPAELVVDVALQDGWHLYGRDVGGGKPIAFAARPGSAFAPAGPPLAPVDARGTITGTARITVPLRRVAAGTRVDVAFSFMVCDALQCLPPRELSLQGDAGQRPLRVLLCVADRGERSERIAAFLAARGFACTTVPYADATAALCDAQDVVVADSPYFDDARRATTTVEAFPRTATPLVAVGFLGTVLLEAQRVAMASGYI